ncbi:6-phosphogluconolactonase [Phycobacter azelaicus]|uniref:6-phosphogluconolactonase n=1 Tax=Phycobacter azelaicus TaxID=2668075 RepID=UPI001867E1B7|nr:6-phosphogluconolactonase [Phycobacter azelaicus]
MNIQEYPDREILSINVAKRLADDLETHLLHHETASLAVAGGSTPGPIFDDLCAASIDWERVHIMASDERWVPSDSDRSNARMIRSRLMTGPAAAATFVPFYVPDRAPEAVMAEIEALIAPRLPLSVVLLGMGEDMHTASLFPGVAGLSEALSHAASPLAVLRPDSQPEARVSLTAPILNGALCKHLVIFGEGKRKALERAVSLPPEEAPVQAVLSGAEVHWAP